jgi:hypothetical protein
MCCFSNLSGNSVGLYALTMGNIEIVLPQLGYPMLRRWARYNVDVPVRVVISKLMKAAINQGCGSALNCGGMALSGLELSIGEQIAVEFPSPYSGQRRKMWCVVRDRYGDRYGIEFITEDDIA